MQGNISVDPPTNYGSVATESTEFADSFKGKNSPAQEGYLCVRQAMGDFLTKYDQLQLRIKK